MKTEQNSAEIKSIADSILEDYKKNIPFHEEMLPHFISGCLAIGLEEEDIRQCFHKFQYRHPDDYPIYLLDELKNYIEFPHIYFWKYKQASSYEIGEYIKAIVEKQYFQQEDMSILVAEIRDYCNKYAHNFKCTHDENNKHVEPKDYFISFLPCGLVKNYPAKLFVKIIIAFRNTEFQNDLKEAIRWSVIIDGYKEESSEDGWPDSCAEFKGRIYKKKDLLNSITDDEIRKEIEKLINEEEKRVGQKVGKKNTKKTNEPINSPASSFIIDFLKNNSQPITDASLHKEMSDEEILNKMRDMGSYVLEKATEERNKCVYKFMLDKAGIKLWPGETDEEFIEFILNTEMLKTGEFQHSCPSHSIRDNYLKNFSDSDMVKIYFNGMYNRLNDDKNILWDKINKIFSRKENWIERIMELPICQKEIKINLLFAVNTKKSFCKAWELLNREHLETELKLDNFKLYILIINKWGNHFLMSLIRKELLEENKICIMAILNSQNEYAIRFLFAYIWHSLVFENKKIAFYEQNDFHLVDYNNYVELCLIAFSDNKYIDDEYIKRHLKYNAHYSINFNKVLKQNDIIDERDLAVYWTEKMYCRGDVCRSIRSWLNEGETLEIGVFAMLNEIAIMIIFKNIALEKPFKIPSSSDKNIVVMQYIFRKFTFEKFMTNETDKYFDILWKEYFQTCIENIANEYEQLKFPKANLPIEQEYAQYLLSKAEDIFSTAIENITYNEYKVFLTESRKQQITKLLKKGTIVQEEADKLIAMAENPETNYYAWSDEEIKTCLLPETDLEKLRKSLEPEFMVRIFEKSILWLIGHRDSELWQTAPWFGMQIFNKSYTDRPTIWAKQLIKIADEWNGSESMLLRICFALGHLRELIGGEIHVVLQKIADNQKYSNIKDKILTQKNLFDRGNFNKGHHRMPSKRVGLCKEELIKGQNREILKE